MLLFLLTVVTISRIHGYLGGLAVVRPALLLGVLAGIYAFLNHQMLNRGALLRTWPARVMAGLGVMACISVPFGMSIGGSGAFILGVYAKVLIYAFLLILAIRHVRDLYTFVWAYVLSAGILVGLSVLVVGISKTQGLQTYDANDVGLVLLVGLPLVIATMQSTASRRVKTLCGVIVAGIGVTLALSLSRGGFLGLLATGLGLLFLLKGVSVGKRIAFVAVAGGALAIAAPTGYWETMETLLNPTEDYNWQTDYGRKEVWKRGVGYMMSNPLTGIGIGNFPRAEGTISEPAVEWEPGPGRRIKWSAAHNSFVQPAAEMGVPGLILFGMLVFGGMAAMFRLRRRLPSRWSRGDPEERFLYHLTLYMPVSLLAFAVTGFFVSFAYLDPVYVLGAFMAGLYASVPAKMRQNRRLGRVEGFRPSSPPRHRAGMRTPGRPPPPVLPGSARPGAAARSRVVPGVWGRFPRP